MKPAYSALIAAGLLTAALTTSAARADVLYTFSEPSGEFGAENFTYLAPDFITSVETVTPTTCSAPGYDCLEEFFSPGRQDFNGTFDVLAFVVKTPGFGGSGEQYDFTPGSFAAVGVYTGAAEVNMQAGPASLTVAQVGSPVSDAPEPSTWALMLAGLAMVGTALRLRARTA